MFLLAAATSTHRVLLLNVSAEVIRPNWVCRWQNCAWEMLSVRCDLGMVSLPGCHLSGHPHPLCYQIHLHEALGRSAVSPCRYAQCLPPVARMKSMSGPLRLGEWTPASRSWAQCPKSFSRVGILYFPVTGSSLQLFLISENLSSTLSTWSVLWLPHTLPSSRQLGNDYWCQYTWVWYKGRSF